jgi:RHS repeat-associated protein
MLNSHNSETSVGSQGRSNLIFAACGMLALPALAFGGHLLNERNLQLNLDAAVAPPAVTMTWDARNHLTSSTNGGITTSYKYDAFGNRVKKGDTRYLTVDNEVVAEFKDDEARQYVHAKSIDDTVAHKDSSGLAYNHLDRQLNTEALTDASGAVIEQYAIDATGRVKTFDSSGIELSGPSATNILFTGRTLDKETGLYYFRARYYEPELGVFISRNPVDARIYLTDTCKDGSTKNELLDSKWCLGKKACKNARHEPDTATFWGDKYLKRTWLCDKGIWIIHPRINPNPWWTECID